MPNERFEEFVAVFLETDGWEASLEQFSLVQRAPSGAYEDNLEQVRQQREKHPFSFLATQITLGPEGFPIHYAHTDEEHERVALARQEAIGIGIWGLVVTEILDRVADKFGSPEVAALSRFFQTDLVDADVADSWARGVGHFFAGDYDEACNVMLPRIETVIRGITGRLGLAIYREPQGATPGQVLVLNELLAALRGCIDESWRRYLRNVLADPLGLNIRNRLLHGLVPRGTKQEAALVVHAACLLRTLHVAPLAIDSVETDS